MSKKSVTNILDLLGQLWGRGGGALSIIVIPRYFILEEDVQIDYLSTVSLVMRRTHFITLEKSHRRFSALNVT